MEQSYNSAIFQNQTEQVMPKHQQWSDEKDIYIRKLEVQIEHQQKIIEQYKQRLTYFQNMLEQAEQVREEADGLSSVKRKRGRPSLSEKQRNQARMLVNQGMSYRRVHEITGISLGMISAIMKDEMVKDRECRK